MQFNNKMNKKGQIDIMLFVLLVLIVTSASLYMCYTSYKETVKLQNSNVVIQLQQKSDLCKSYIGYMLSESAKGTGDFETAKQNFGRNFQLDDLKSLLGNNVEPKNFVSKFQQTSDGIKIIIKNARLEYKDTEAGIVLISYTFDIESEAKLEPVQA
jgi:hypothetical protein